MPSFVHEGRSLAYNLIGLGSPVVMIHGLGSGRRDWGPQVDCLAERWSVLTLDLRGHGESSAAPEPYVMRDLANDVAALIDHLALGPCHVVGLSLGGMIAFQLAVDAPRLVRSLTIVNSGPEVVPRTLGQRFMVYSRVLGARWLPMRRLAAAIGRGLFPHPEQAEKKREFIESFSKNDRASYRAALSAIVGWSVADRLPHIEAPTLVVSGDRDYTPVEVKRGYAAQMPDASVAVIEDSGHATPIDQPERFNAVLAAFLLDVEAGTSARRPRADPALETATSRASAG